MADNSESGGYRILESEDLYRYCDADQFNFTTTDELPVLEELIGQDRAMESLQFGIGIKQHGFNLYVQGPAGIGKYTMVRRHLELQARDCQPPSDWCYVHNFSRPHKPMVLRLSAGKAVGLRVDMGQLVGDLLVAIPLAFETEEYKERVKEVEAGFKDRRSEMLADITREADESQVAFVRTPEGFAFIAQKDGEQLDTDAFEQLSETERQHFEETIEGLRNRLSDTFHKLTQWQYEVREKVRDINSDVGRLAVGSLVEDLKLKYSDHVAIQSYLEDVEQDVMAHLGDFIDNDDMVTLKSEENGDVYHRYRVNVIVDHTDTDTVPVIYEKNPLFPNLVGRIEHQSREGMLSTDFTLIKPGALHRANGGYLIIDAHRLLQQPYAWEGLKRALYASEITIESLGQVYSLVDTISLEPQPIPLDIKVVLIGDRFLYHLLSEADPDFAELFKVSADFEESMERSDENDQLYARMMATLIQRKGLLCFDRGAVARVIEYSARLVGDGERLSTHMLSIADLLHEVDYWSRQQGCDCVTANLIQQAVDRQQHRYDRIQRRLHDEVRRGVLLLNTHSDFVGQINGLFVIDLGRHSFSHPVRITATTRFGEGEFVDIEREVELGGALHSKGVMILSAFIAARYAANRPLSLAASLVFEQTYGPIDGDSASVAECCVLLSSLADVPLHQGLAVTGSINQHGQIQAIGGINDKIEGFFDICCIQGLDGSQGVIIPKINIIHLMLRQDVRDAVAAGRFTIYAVETVDQVMELLSGLSAGQRDEQGKYSAGSFNQQVESRVIALAELRKNYH